MAARRGSVLAEKKRRAIKLLKAGKLDEAYRLLEQVCARRSEDQDAWMFRSMVHGMRGEHERVLECADRVVALNPENSWAHSNRGSALAALGRREESIAALQRALELSPDDPAVLSNLGNALYLAERVEDAEPLFRRALELKPDHLESHYGLGHVLSAMGLPDEAIVSYQRAAQINPDKYEVLFGLGNTCLNIGRLDNAKMCFERALSVAPDPVEVHIALARVERMAGQYDAALVHLERSLQEAPDSVALLTEQAELYQRKGDRERAREVIRAMVEEEIVTPTMVMTYSFICRYFDECDEVVRLGERLLAVEGLGRGDRSTVHFALGAVFDRLGDHDAAFDHYRKGNDLTPHRFDRAAWSAEVESVIEGYAADVVPALVQAGNQSERPIFIVGMPRSGTSLVEQILASHPEVYGAGELADVVTIANQLSARVGGFYFEHLDALAPELLDELAEGHLRRLGELSGGAARVTDKMPHNFQHLGLIGQLFPRARVIHCTRDPRDTCLSIYFQRFNGTHSYSWEQADLAHYYREYERLMAHWREVLEIEMIEVSYEAVVEDLEGEARRMVDFVGLEWDERCLRFHETERHVATASFDQVRQPLYTGSVGRWRRYERHLGPLLEGLGMQDG